MATINVDASWKARESKDAIGVVFRDSSERCFAVKRNEVYASSVMAAKALAVFEGCLLAQQKNLTHDIVESDSKLVISWLN